MDAALTRLLIALRPDERSDAELLSSIARNDQPAFAELVRRYGPLVYGVCRRTVGDRHLADDAFQATFLVLAQKAATVRSDAVASFLYATATFVSLRARTAAQRRRRRETPTFPLPEPAYEPVTAEPEGLAELAQEVANLPAKLRTVVLVCELDETPRAIAAARLGIPEGTLSSRLAAARKTLANRLRQRGVTVPLTALAIAGVPAATASPTSTALAQEVLRAMTIAKFKPLAVAAMLFVAVAGFGLSAISADENPASTPPATPIAPFPPINRILIAKGRELSLIDPTGDAKPTVVGKNAFEFATLSPQGDRFTHEELLDESKPQPTDSRPNTRNVIRRVDGTGTSIVIPKMDPAAPVWPDVIRWSADGKTLLVLQQLTATGPDGRAVRYSHWEYDPATGKKTEIVLPKGHLAVDWTADKQSILTYGDQETEDGRVMTRMAIVARATGKVDYFTSEKRTAYACRLSPDGKSVCLLSYDPDPVVENAISMQLYVMTIATRAEKRITQPDGNWGYIISMLWSPDGTRLAYVRNKRYPGKGDDAAANAQIVTCDPDGGNLKVIAARTLRGEPAIFTRGYVLMDWR